MIIPFFLWETAQGACTPHIRKMTVSSFQEVVYT
jgi:hypothetical protein